MTMPRVRLLCGAHRSARARHVDALVRAQWPRALLVVPTRQTAARRIEQILLAGDHPGAWGRPVLAFDDFTVELLRAEGTWPRRARDFERRLLLDQAIESLQPNRPISPTRPTRPTGPTRPNRSSNPLDALGSAADTRGFRAHMLRVITQIKQAAIEPDEFRRRVRTRRFHSSLDQAVADVYEAYQAALRQAGVYDVPGLFWEADLRCRTRRPVLLEGVDLLALDGFDDFTPSEFRLLTSLAPHVDALVIGLNYDPKPDRKDLYVAPARTAAEIRERFDAIIESFEEPDPATYVEFAAASLFWRDKPRMPAGLKPNLEIVACPDFMQEVETIGRRVKSLIVDQGVPAEEIAVVSRRLGLTMAGTIRSVFEEFGIPFRLIQQPTLWESAIGRFLLALLDAIESWSHEAVVDVLTSPWTTLAPGCADAIPCLARAAQVVAGREEWHRRVRYLIQRLDTGRGEDIEALQARMPLARDAADTLRNAIDALAHIESMLPTRATPAAFAAALDAMIDAAGIEAAIASPFVIARRRFDADEAISPTRLSPSDLRESEQPALAALRNLLGAWHEWNDRAPVALSRRGFLDAFRDALQQTEYRLPQAGEGVACLDAESIRQLEFDYVFLAGANEGEMPCPPAINAVYGDEDVESLNEAGIRVEGKRAHSEREALQFHHVLNAARCHLCITWHVCSRQGKETQPSPYVVDLIDLFSGVPVAARSRGTAAFVPALHEAASWRDVRNVAFARAPVLVDLLEGKGLQPVVSGNTFAAIRAGAAVETQRHDRTPFGCYDGVLENAAVRETLAARFGDQHQFSVDQIETYRACPFRFFTERVLGIEEAEMPVAEFDARVRGAIVHDALQAFHEQFRGTSAPEIPEDESITAMQAALDEAFQEKARRSINAPPGVEQVEHQRMSAMLSRYLRIERERDERDWKPEHFEVAFGQVRGGSAARGCSALSVDDPGRPEPFPLETSAGIVRFAGRIDRIDRQGADARIIDYKTGALPGRSEIASGLSVQLQIYALAVEEFLLPGVACREARFQQVGRDKIIEALGRNKKEDEWPARQEQVREIVAATVAAIRAGRFPPTSTGDACAWCAARRVCRYTPGRVERKGTPA